MKKPIDSLIKLQGAVVKCGFSMEELTKAFSSIRKHKKATYKRSYKYHK